MSTCLMILMLLVVRSKGWEKKRSQNTAEELLQRRIPAGAIEVPCKNDLRRPARARNGGRKKRANHSEY